MTESLLISITRTVVPLIVGLLVSGAAQLGLGLDEGLLSQVVTLAVTTVYYAGVRFLETHVGPSWGWLVGYARAPRYDNTTERIV